MPTAGRTGSVRRSIMRLCLWRVPMQRFSLLGSTGSIGTQTLDIVAENPDRFEIVAMSAGSNIELLAEQVIPRIVSRHTRQCTIARARTSVHHLLNVGKVTMIALHPLSLNNRLSGGYDRAQLLLVAGKTAPFRRNRSQSCRR